MKKAFLIVLILLSGVSVALAATPGCDSRGVCTYQPLEPLPGAQAGQTGNNFPALVAGIFKVLLTFGGLFAVVMLTVAGIGYMVSESVVDIDKAKKRAQAALWGLLLLGGCWLILNTINPNILKFDMFNEALNRLRTSGEAQPGGTPSVATTRPAPPTDAEINSCGSKSGYAIRYNPDGSWTCTNFNSSTSFPY